jgi:hypothetical protein
MHDDTDPDTGAAPSLISGGTCVDPLSDIGLPNKRLTDILATGEELYTSDKVEANDLLPSQAHAAPPPQKTSGLTL